MVLCLTLCACSPLPADTPEPGVMFDEVILRNDTRGEIENVRIDVERFNRFFSCNYILPRTNCSTRFKKRRYQHNSIQITWTQRGQAYDSGSIFVSTDGILDVSRVHKAVVVILDNRQFTARFETGN